MSSMQHTSRTKVSERAGAHVAKTLLYYQTHSKLSCCQPAALRSFHSTDIIRECKVGTGAFGIVYRVQLKEDEDEKKKDRHRQQHYYALKCLTSKTMSREDHFRIAAVDLALEADLLSRLDHENIIKCHGVASGCISRSFVDHDNGYFVLLDLLEDTLEDRLVQLRKLFKPSSSFFMGGGNRRSSRAGMRSRIETIALGIAKGMTYLHEKHVVLRDLKPANVGFDHSGNVKLFDFGLAREAHLLPRTEIAGTLRYLAPEGILLKKCNLSSDVYSFGVLLWEICTLQQPYSQFTSAAAFKSTVMCLKWRHPVQSIPSSLLRDLISSCWDHFQAKRPPFTHIQNVLQEYCEKSSSSSTSQTRTAGSKKKQKQQRSKFLTTTFQVLTPRKKAQPSLLEKCCRSSSRTPSNYSSECTESTMSVSSTIEYD